MDLRALLRESTKQVHADVENISVMKRYASANLEKDHYECLLHSKYSLWDKHTPNLRSLPSTYKEFYHDYLNALTLDCEHPPRAAEPKTSVNEFSFFYILLGSAMGASVIIKNYKESSLSFSHLTHLSTKARPLWGEFIKLLEKDETANHSQEISRDSVMLFENFKEQVLICEERLETRH